jgi:hypothetical protein
MKDEILLFDPSYDIIYIHPDHLIIVIIITIIE